MSRTSIVERDTSTISEYLISVSITSGLVRGVAEVGNNRRTRDGWIKSTNVNVNGEGGKVGESKPAAFQTYGRSCSKSFSTKTSSCVNHSLSYK